MLFFFNDTATTEIYTLSLHDALPISVGCGDITVLISASGSWTVMSTCQLVASLWISKSPGRSGMPEGVGIPSARSEEHTSELQSQSNLVCRLLLDKKKQKPSTNFVTI